MNVFWASKAFRQIITFAVASFLSFSFSTPASADDDSGPNLREISISPTNVDVSSGASAVRFKISAKDETGIYLANISCVDSTANRIIFLVFKPSETQEPTKLWEFNGFLPLISLVGDARDFVVEFEVPIRHRATPGKVSCGILLADVLRKDTIVSNAAYFTIVRDGIGFTNPTPTPTSRPLPAPTPTPTPTPCQVSSEGICLGANGFSFIRPKFSSPGRGKASISWGTLSEKAENFKFTVLEKRREAKSYKTVMSKSSASFLERRGLKSGTYDYLVKVKLRSGATEEIKISGRVK